MLIDRLLCRDLSAARCRVTSAGKVVDLISLWLCCLLFHCLSNLSKFAKYCVYVQRDGEL